MAAALLVPIKAFDRAKLRLAPRLTAGARRDLARWMAARVLASAGTCPAYVVCDDVAVSAWAEAAGATVIWTPARGLDGAVDHGVTTLAAAGFDQVVVSHADLPLARQLDRLADFDGITLIPDRFDDGTNVACIPSDSGFRFAYGPGSFRRHEAEAQRTGRPVRIRKDRRLGWDIDRPADLELPPDLAAEVDLPIPVS